MAITRGSVYQATFGFVDRDDNRAHTSVYLPGGLTDVEAYDSAVALGTAMQALSNAALYSVTLTLQSFDPAVDVSAVVEASDVERKGVFTFQASNPYIQTRMEVPSIRNELVVDGTNNLNTTDAAVIAFFNAVLLGPGGAGNGPVSINGADMVTRKGFPYKMHRGSSKG